MRRYREEDEYRVLLQEKVKDWTQSGLLTADQGKQLDAELRTTLRRTGLMLRLGLALFAAIAVGATVALTIEILDLRRDAADASVIGFCGLACFVAADALVARFRLYRHGVEEALAMGAVALVGGSIAFMTNALIGTIPSGADAVLGFAAGAGMSALVYLRFGFQYAAIGSMVLAAFVPLQLHQLSYPLQHVLAAIVCAGAFTIARTMKHAARGDVRANDATVLQAAALIAVYLAINVHARIDWLGGFRGGQPVAWFDWSAWVLTWVIPTIGVWRGILDRDRWLMRAGLACGLVTLLTNKLYLGWPRETWDPMLLGLLLTAVAIAVRRWLVSGPGGERGGFTPARLLQSESEAIRLVSIASLATQPPQHQPAEPQPSGFDGGRSGGGGGGADF